MPRVPFPSVREIFTWWSFLQSFLPPSSMASITNSTRTHSLEHFCTRGVVWKYGHTSRYPVVLNERYLPYLSPRQSEESLSTKKLPSYLGHPSLVCLMIVSLKGYLVVAYTVMLQLPNFKFCVLRWTSENFWLKLSECFYIVCRLTIRALHLQTTCESTRRGR